MRICLDGRMNAEASVVALGMFDGVHIGHQVLLQKARVKADQLHVPMVVQTFSTHPLCLLDQDRCPPMLTTLNERIRLLEAQGVDILCAPPFTETVRDMPPEDFVGRLVRQWKPKDVVVGFNYTFGSHGAGTPVFLHALGDALGFDTHIVPEIRLEGEAVSATRIRTLLAQGDAAQARKLLGRPYRLQVALSGRVGGKCTLTCADNGKQQPAAGLYRALLGCDRHEVPILAMLDGKGRATCEVPQTLELGMELSLRLIAQAVR